MLIPHILNKALPKQRSRMATNGNFNINGQRTSSTNVLIIGSGPIGAVYARTVINADPNINVLMVEMGEQ